MIFVRDILRIPRLGVFRLVGVFDERAFLFDLKAPRTVIAEHSLPALALGVEKGRIEPLDGKEFNAPPNTVCSEAQQTRADRHLAIVRSLIANGEQIFVSSRRSRLVASAARENGICSKTVHSALYRYWRGGMTIYALMPRFETCGAPGKDKPANGPRGRKPAEGIARAPALSAEMIKAFETCTNRYYKRSRHITLAETFRRALERLSTRCVLDEETGLPVTFVVDEDVRLPTERQFRHWYGKQNRAKSDAKARLGDAKFAMRSRARLSYAAQDNNLAGGRFIIDATKLDTNLVARHDRTAFLGTPVLYIVVDEFTALIVGFWISLEEACWQSAAMAILGSVEDKVELCRRYGLVVEPWRWPISGMAPMRYLFDRGEAKGDKASSFVEKSGLIVENTAPYRGDLKGVGEKRFDLINCAFRGEVPGSRDEDSGKRGEDDPRLESILNLDEVTQVVLACILYLNDRELKKFRRSRAMIADGVPPIASAMWDWCMRTGRVALQRFETAELAIALMPEGTGTITNQGVRFDGLFYTCERAEAEGWFEAVDAPGTLRKLKLSWHPWLVDAVYLHVPGEKEPLQAVLTPFSQAYAGFSFDELHASRRQGRIAEQGRRLDQVLNHAEFRNRVQFIVEGAAQERLSDLRPRDLKNARANKAAERTARRFEAKQELRERIGQHVSADRPLLGSNRQIDDLGEGEID